MAKEIKTEDKSKIFTDTELKWIREELEKIKYISKELKIDENQAYQVLTLVGTRRR